MYSLPLGPLRNNMASAAARAVKQAVRPHIPMIKFPPRDPGLKPQDGVIQSKGMQSSDNKIVTNRPSSSSPKGVIDSYELPKKYRRKPLTSEEIEYIEKGGQV